MSIDLEQSLDALARSVHDDATAARMTGQVHSMVTRIRRRRAARYATSGVVGVGAATAVVLGGLQLADRTDTQAPPASAGPDEGFGRCGTTVVDPDAAAGLEFSLVPTIGAVTGGPEPTVALGLGVEGDLRGVAWVPDVTAVVARDGVVVGEAVGASREGPDIDVPLISCEDGGPLAPGDYELYALVELTPAPGDAATDDAPTAILGGPWDLRLDAEQLAGVSPPPAPPAATDPPAAEAEAERQASEAALQWVLDQAPQGSFPACASAVPSEADPVLTLDLTLEDRPYAGGETVTGTASLTSTGGRTVLGNAPTAGAQLVLTQGGVVVGRGMWDPEDVDLVTVTPDQPVDVPFTGLLDVCTVPYGETVAALPPGRYDAYAVTQVMLKEVTGPDGEATSVTELVTARSNPVPVVIE